LNSAEKFRRELIFYTLTSPRLFVRFSGSIIAFDRSLKYEYKKEADIYQVSVIDTSKDEVVRKIPPDEVVRFMENIKELFGALLDVNA
jgi:uncharacterized FlaG/YvyC family protein